ncbi:MAG: right-handed parallel beta-helix repeat-containing protein [Deltaproteobacteria bacterium]|nr:right-handed parallel beta-helix repeat-containing protein [Deltaproteobacteria bacterium]
MRFLHATFFFIITYFLILPVAGAWGIYHSGSITLSTTCTSFNPVNTTVFAEGLAGPGGDGSYFNPYGSLAEVIDRLAQNPIVDTVCLKGTFTEALSLPYDIQTTSLAVLGYQGGATIDANGASYALSSSAYSNLQNLTIRALTLQGFSYAGVSIHDLDTLVADTITIDASGASYGIYLYGVEEVTLKKITLAHSSYAAISGQDLGKFSIATSSLSDVGHYAVTLNYTDEATVQTSQFAGYDYTGLDLEADSVTLNRNTLSGSGHYHGLKIHGATSTLITNNFVLDHTVSGVDVGEAEGSVYLFNNSFSNNKVAAKLNGGGPHALYPIAYNNIFYSNDSQSAYDENAFHANTEASEESNFLLSTLSSPTDNPDLLLTSDYNLFYGAVTVDNASPITFSTWQTWGYDAHSLTGNPLFASTSNLHIKNGSPAIDKGLNLSLWVPQDIDGQSRTTLLDIGADEKGKSPSTFKFIVGGSAFAKTFD